MFLKISSFSLFLSRSFFRCLDPSRMFFFTYANNTFFHSILSYYGNSLLVFMERLRLTEIPQLSSYKTWRINKVHISNYKLFIFHWTVHLAVSISPKDEQSNNWRIKIIQQYLWWNLKYIYCCDFWFCLFFKYHVDPQNTSLQVVSVWLKNLICSQGRDAIMEPKRCRFKSHR